MDLPHMIKEHALNSGYFACGIISTDPFQEFEQALQERIKQFPEAAQYYISLRETMNDRLSVPWANSIVICARRYGKYIIPDNLDKYFGRYYLFDRRIKTCPEFNIVEKFQTEINKLGLLIKRGRVPYRWAGARAGISSFGKNCFAFSRQYGSWIDFDAWFVDAKLPFDSPISEPLCPENCRICIDSCPTGALESPFVMRRDRCIAHLTYEAKMPIDPDLWKKMQAWVYGCDVCQQVCPLNKGKWESIEKATWLNEISEYLSPVALAQMSAETYQKFVHPLFWYISVDDLDRWHNNAYRALQYAYSVK